MSSWTSKPRIFVLSTSKNGNESFSCSPHEQKNRIVIEQVSDRGIFEAQENNIMTDAQKEGEIFNFPRSVPTPNARCLEKEVKKVVTSRNCNLKQCRASLLPLIGRTTNEGEIERILSGNSYFNHFKREERREEHFTLSFLLMRRTQRMV